MSAAVRKCTRWFPLWLLACCAIPSAGSAQVYELRTYTTNEGKLNDLHARFRDHTIRIFARHGMESVGYWTPTDGPEAHRTLIYVIKHKSREAAKASWAAFRDDPEWQKVYKNSEAGGRILAKRPESVYMVAHDYSPEIKGTADASDADHAVFELRIYKTKEGKLDNLNARFRDHTIRLFARHGIKSIAYWSPADDPDAQDTLIYIIRHDSREAANKSWPAFLQDPEWRKAAQESNRDGRLLREPPHSTYMKATDYSPMK